MALLQFKGIAEQMKGELAEARDSMDSVPNAPPTRRNDLLKNSGISLDRAARTLNDLRAAQQVLLAPDQEQGRKVLDVLGGDLRRARQGLPTIISRREYIRYSLDKLL